MHRYDRAEETILDTDLPGCSAADVNLSFKDGRLFLHAIKRATDTEPARRYSGVHSVREGMVRARQFSSSQASDNGE